MAVHVPYIVIMQILNSMSHAHSSSSQHEKEARQAELEAHLQALQIKAGHERSQTQAGVLTKLIDACSHLENRRFDLVFESIRATHGLLADQQSELHGERKELARQKAETPAREIKKILYLRKRETEISNELDEIRRTSVMLQMQAQNFALESGTNFTLPALPGY